MSVILSVMLAVAAPLSDAFERGVCVAHTPEEGARKGYGTPASAETLDHLATLGVSHISLTPIGWLSDRHATVIYGEHVGSAMDGAVSSAQLTGVIEQADARGLQVVLAPHLHIRAGAWRGHLAPLQDGKPAWATFWKNYREFLLLYADLAKERGVSTLVVGSELVSALEHDPAPFVALIEEVRRRFDGTLVYSANWDESPPPEVWAAVDQMGVQFYPILSKLDDPSQSVLDAAIDERLGAWEQRATSHGKPLVLTEVGYTSSAVAASRPWEWPERMKGPEARPAPALQARAYRALFKGLARHEGIEGAYIWKYFSDRETPVEGPQGFSPRGKSAESVLCEAYALDRQRCSSGPRRVGWDL